MTTSVHHKSTLDGLPKQFVAAMRTLFDLMDDKRTGFVRLIDIENRWQDRGSRGLPSGAIECLRKVTPANGLLSFERFCAGLRICLLRNQPSRNNASPRKQHHGLASRPASVPIPDSERLQTRKTPPMGRIVPSSGSAERLPSGANPVPSSSPPSRAGRYNTAAVRPNNAKFSQQRATSMPHLQAPVKPFIPGGERQPVYNSSPVGNRPVAPPRMSRAMVTMALEKWRMMKSYHPPDIHATNTEVKAPQPLRENHLRRESVSYPNLPAATNEGPGGIGLRVQERGPAAKKANRKREPRRHTVSNGIDYNMIKRLKLLEQEKDCLLQGLDMVERARNWYIQQIAAVTEKLERVSKYDVPSSDYSTDAHRERLNFQMTRIYEVNQYLNSLMETSEKGFPIHMNLAVHQQNIYDRQKATSQTIQRLKEQNHALTDEVTKKSNIISQLESEKSALIRELFQARSQQQKDSNDTTLW